MAPAPLPLPGDVLVPRPAPGMLSLVIPIYFEEEVLPLLRQALTAWMDAKPYPCEAVLVDDGSRDNSLPLLRAWAKDDPRARVISFSRNFGHQAAVTAGMDAARGDAVVIIDADLQDPIDVVDDMVARYREGYDIVYGQRAAREGESAFKRFTAWLFYRLMGALTQGALPPDTGDFRLVSRRALDAVLQMRESHRFLRGMFAWAGFHQVSVLYTRHARAGGETKYPLRKMMAFAWNAVVSFSTLPIRLVSYMGLGIALLGGLYGFYSVVQWWYYNTVSGWPSIIVLLCLIGGTMLIGLGIIGEYVGRIYEQVKDRPLYLIKETHNHLPRDTRG